MRERIEYRLNRSTTRNELQHAAVNVDNAQRLLELGMLTRMLGGRSIRNQPTNRTRNGDAAENTYRDNHEHCDYRQFDAGL